MAKIIYVSYGTNLYTDRFNAYIQGGTIAGADKVYPGCKDKTPPEAKLVLASEALETYFSRDSYVWGTVPFGDQFSSNYGGLALVDFLTTKPFTGVRVVDPSTQYLADLIEQDAVIMAGYVISTDQFCDVMKQENPSLDQEIEIPNVLFEELSLDNPKIDLRGRTGDIAIQLSNGQSIEIDIKGAYSALLYLGEVEVNGEIVKAVTFTSPISYEMSSARAYMNMFLANVPLERFDEARQLADARIMQYLGVQPDDKLSRLNPATYRYLEMVANGIVEVGQGNNDWTFENAFEYCLNRAPFNKHQYPELADLMRDYRTKIQRQLQPQQSPPSMGLGF